MRHPLPMQPPQAPRLKRRWRHAKRRPCAWQEREPLGAFASLAAKGGFRLARLLVAARAKMEARQAPEPREAQGQALGVAEPAYAPTSSLAQQMDSQPTARHTLRVEWPSAATPVRATDDPMQARHLHGLPCSGESHSA